MKGAMAFYDDTTTACMVSKRYFFYMAVGEKMSSASAVVQVAEENTLSFLILIHLLQLGQ